ncbi:MAG: TolC family protein [Candidatus Solibacter sp.]
MFAAIAILPVARAQNAPAPAPLTLEQAVSAALKNYPALRVSQEQINAASAGIQLARTAYLPRVDGIAQVNRATRNNVFGMLLPQSVIPSISGPVIGSNNLGSVWGSAVGGLVSWEPFDFGLRSANVAAATAARAQSEASLIRTRFEIEVAAADAYLTLIAAQETIRAAQAGVDRADTILKIISAQVNAELRPGADQSRAEAELAAARTQLIQAQQAASVARANLAQFVALQPAEIAIAEGALLQLPPATGASSPNVSGHPALLEQNATIEQARAQLRVLERSYFPKFSVQGAAYARGTGAEITGNRLGGVNGLAPNVQNYAIGFTVTVPLMDLPAIHAREAAQSAVIRSQIARSEQLTLELRTQWNRAVAALSGARQVAANTPLQVYAAKTATQQATARYQAGLGNITDLAEAQRLQTQAEIDDALARLSVWRGLLMIAGVAGDVQPFIVEVGR